MADETPICKKCGTPKTILKGKRNQHFIGCPKCSVPGKGGVGTPQTDSTSGESSTEPGRTTSPPASTPEKKTQKKNFWW
jgi:ssDNA-binding Zn-finger/Zn-ribbon topoisomerase 1